MGMGVGIGGHGRKYVLQNMKVSIHVCNVGWYEFSLALALVLVLAHRRGNECECDRERRQQSGGRWLE